MENSIIFPNLGITLENVGQSFSVFGFEIAYYGVMIAIGILAGFLMAEMVAKKSGQDPEIYMDLVLYAVIFGIIGARIYYVIFAWDLYKNDLLSIFNLRNGGLAIYGGVIGAVLTLYVYAKRKKLSFATLLDTGAPGLITGQIIGRWGNFFNREAFGDYTDSLFAMQIQVSRVRKSDITETLASHIQMIDGVEFIQVHPTFLYEGAWNLCILLLMLWTWKKKKFNGQVFLVYLAGYGLGRFWIEGLRTDPLMVPGLGIRVSQALALALFVFAAGYMIYRYVRPQKENILQTDAAVKAETVEHVQKEGASGEPAEVTQDCKEQTDMSETEAETAER